MGISSEQNAQKIQVCKECGISKKKCEFELIYRGKNKEPSYRKYCKECRAKYNKFFHRKFKKENGINWADYNRGLTVENFLQTSYRNAKYRSKKINREFTITKDDIKNQYTKQEGK